MTVSLYLYVGQTCLPSQTLPQTQTCLPGGGFMPLCPVVERQPKSKVLKAAWRQGLLLLGPVWHWLEGAGVRASGGLRRSCTQSTISIRPQVLLQHVQGSTLGPAC